jgi:hypothetical protein
MLRKYWFAILLVLALVLGAFQPVAAVASQQSTAGINRYLTFTGTIYAPSSTNGRVSIARVYMVLDTSNNTLYYRVYFPPAISENGNLELYVISQGEDYVVTLYSGQSLDSHATYQGSAVLTSTQADALMMGQYRLRISGSNELSGMVARLINPMMFRGRMAASSEVPAVNSIATGSFFLRLAPGNEKLYYQIGVADIKSITVAHFHAGWPGESGPPVIPLYALPSDTRIFDVSHPLVGSVQLTGLDLLNLINGYYYINIHTTANPNGEIRGQVEASYTAYMPFTSRSTP